MYVLMLFLAIALVILSPIALELYLTLLESRAERKRFTRCRHAGSPRSMWAPSRQHS